MLLYQVCLKANKYDIACPPLESRVKLKKKNDWKMFSKIFHIEININLRNPRLEPTKQEPKRRQVKEKTLFGQQGEAWMPTPFQTPRL